MHRLPPLNPQSFQMLEQALTLDTRVTFMLDTRAIWELNNVSVVFIWSGRVGVVLAA